MEREQEEEVQRITAEYVAEDRAGHKPRLSDFLARYPRYTGAITEFVAYYHAVEVQLSADPMSMPPLSAYSQSALERAEKHLSELAQNRPITHLLKRTHFPSLSQLAAHVGVTPDILENLDQNKIALTTLPQEILKRIADAVMEPLSRIQMEFGRADSRKSSPALAESTPFYFTQDVQLAGFGEQTFRDAIEQSMELSAEQKQTWREILTRENL